MIYSDLDILKLIEQKKFAVDPYDPSRIQGASVDLTLGDKFLKLKDHEVGCLRLNHAPEYTAIESKKIVIPPHAFILATTVEKLELAADMAGILEGRSSIGRMGLFIQNAGLVTPGFRGQLTLELYNANNLPIELEKGVKICQLLLFPLSSKAAHPYQGKYQDQANTTGSKAFQDFTGGRAWLPKIKIALGSDHAGFATKQQLVNYATAQKLSIEDLGPQTTDSVDYPDYAKRVAEKVLAEPNTMGVLICGSGQGMMIAANRHHGIRAALCLDEESAALARQHNDANILVLAERKTEAATRLAIFQTFFSTAFEGGRHLKRIEKIEL